MNIVPENGNQQWILRVYMCEKWLNTNLQIVLGFFYFYQLQIVLSIKCYYLSLGMKPLHNRQYKCTNWFVLIYHTQYSNSRKKREQTSNSFSVFCIMKSSNLLFRIKVKHFIISIIASAGLCVIKKFFGFFFLKF